MKTDRKLKNYSKFSGTENREKKENLDAYSKFSGTEKREKM